MGPPRFGKDYKWYISGIFPANWGMDYATDPTFKGTRNNHWSYESSHLALLHSQERTSSNLTNPRWKTFFFYSWSYHRFQAGNQKSLPSLPVVDRYHQMGPILGGIKQCKFMVILMDFPYNSALFTWHILGDRLIPEQLLCVDRGILHVGPTKSLTFSPGFSLRVAMFGLVSDCIFLGGWVSFIRGARIAMQPWQTVGK